MIPANGTGLDWVSDADSDRGSSVGYAWMQPGNLVVDGGNSYLIDTERRFKALSAEGFHFMGLGASGRIRQ